MIPTLTTLAPHRNTHLTYDTRALMSPYLDADSSQFLYINRFFHSWPGMPTPRDLAVAIAAPVPFSPTQTHTPIHPLTLITPKQAM